MPTPLPVVMSFLVCEQIIREQVTNKTSIIGIFSRLLPHKFPATPGVMSVYLMTTGGRGEYRIRLSLVRVEGDRMVAEWVPPDPLIFEDARTVIECSMKIGDVPLPEPGDYELRLFFDDRLAGLIPITAELQPQGGP